MGYQKQGVQGTKMPWLQEDDCVGVGGEGWEKVLEDRLGGIMQIFRG